MKRIAEFTLALAIAATAATAWAAGHDQRPSSRLAPTAAPMTQAMPGSTGADMPCMQTQAMREMHDKMMAARPPEARHALMDEHMDMMQATMQTMMDRLRTAPAK